MHENGAMHWDEMEWISLKGTASGRSSRIKRGRSKEIDLGTVLDGLAPEARKGHTATVWKDSLFVFGGVNKEVACADNGIWIFRFAPKDWRKTETGGASVPARHSHSAVVYENSMWIFGGVDQHGNPLGDTYEFDFDRFTWQCVVTSKNQAPAPRWGHSCTLYGDSMYIFGGRDKTTVFNDCYEFHFNSRSWNQIHTSGKPPYPRFYHKSALYDNRIYVLCGRNLTDYFDDFYSIDVETKKWLKHDIPEEFRLKRYGHTMEVFRDYCVVLGGTPPNETLLKPFIHFYHFPSSMWSSIPIQPNPVLQRHLHSSSMYGNCLFLFAGCSGSKYWTDVTILKLTGDQNRTTGLTRVNTTPEVRYIPKLPSTSSNLTSTKIRLKCSFEGELRVLSSFISVTFTELSKQLKEEYEMEPSIVIFMQYKDVEGDNISIRSDEGLQEAFQYFLESNTNSNTSLRMEIIKATPKVTEPRIAVAGHGHRKQQSFDKKLTVHAPERWRLGPMIGKGAFGTVYLALNLKTGEIIAVKKLQLSPDLADYDKKLQALEKEINILSTLNHPNIVQYLGCKIEDNVMDIIVEYVPGGSLHSMISKFGPLSETLVKQFTRQIMSGLYYLHEKGIIHRDIKGGNILVDQYGRVKLSDFGAATKIESVTNTGTSSIAVGGSDCESITGTAYWMAPEVIKQNSYGRKCDVWSVGCTVIEMLTGIPPWSHLQPVSALFHIASSDELPTLPSNISTDCTDFICKCLTRDVVERPSVKALLKHKFLLKKKEIKGKENLNLSKSEERWLIDEEKSIEEEEDIEESSSNSVDINLGAPLQKIGKIKSQPILGFPNKDAIQIPHIPPLPKDKKTHPTRSPDTHKFITNHTSTPVTPINISTSSIPPPSPSASFQPSRPRGRSTPEKPLFVLSKSIKEIPNLIRQPSRRQNPPPSKSPNLIRNGQGITTSSPPTTKHKASPPSRWSTKKKKKTYMHLEKDKEDKIL